MRKDPLLQWVEVIERMKDVLQRVEDVLQKASNDGRLSGMRLTANCVLGIVLLAVSGFVGARVNAETLAQALSAAYRTNPQLDAERARLRATDEEVPKAKSGYRPVITGSADIGYQRSNTKPNSPADGRTTPKGYSINATQSLFSGFRTVNTVRAAEANVRAGRELLRQTEQTVLLSAVQAYVDVIRDRAIVRLRQNNVRVLSRELKATKDRFAVGEVTRTDVAQARARRALAVSALDLARANLRSSRASYQQVIGHAPGRLARAMPHRRLLPKTLQQAIEIGREENPSVVRALYLEQAARHNVDTIRGELLPSARIDGNYSKRYDPSRLTKESSVGTITGRLSIPFYQGGGVFARIRQAKQTHISTLQVIQQARTEARAAVIRAWSQLVAARTAVMSDRTAVRANQIALNGVREEERVGQRTLLDVLNAQQELLNSEVILATDKRNEVFASYNLLSALGRLNVKDLSLAARVYDPEQHYSEVRRKWWGLRIAYPDGRHERMNLWDSVGRRHKSSR